MKNIFLALISFIIPAYAANTQINSLPLHKACLDRDIKEVIKLINSKTIPINSTDKTGKTPLHCACFSGDIRIVEYLLGSGADINAITNSKSTALHIACEFGYMQIARYLVCNSDTCINKQNIYGNTPLHIALMIRNIDLIYLMLSQKPDITIKNRENKTALDLACSVGLTVVKHLMTFHNAKINMNVKHQGGTSGTTLHLACYIGNLGIVKYLIEEKKCDPHQNTPHGFSLCDIAVRRNHKNIFKYLVEELKLIDLDDPKILEDVIYVAAAHKRCKILKYLVQSNKIKNPSSLLIYASKECIFYLVKYLISHNKVDINYLDSTGASALHLACNKDFYGIAQYLVQNGADIKLKNSSGETAIDIATKNNHLFIANFLKFKAN